MAPTILRLGTTAPLLAAALALSACSGSGSTDATSAATTSETTSATSTSRSTATTSSTSRTSPTSTTSTTTSAAPATSTTPSTSPSADTAAAPVGAQQCGSVTTVTGSSVRVRIVSGDLTCDAAEQLLRTYYADVPTRGQGSGGFLEVDGWSCSSSSAAGYAATGQATGCTTSEGAKVVTEGDPLAPPATPSSDPSPPPTSAAPPAANATTAPGAGGSCAQIDQPTLDQMFPDGVQDEQRCASFIGGESAH